MGFQVPSCEDLQSEDFVGNASHRDCLPMPIEGDLEMTSDVGVMLPTYCEAQNIERLIDEIERLNLNASILVIDDSSPDNTSDVVRNCQQRYDNVLLLVRPGKRGLGTAITDGFRAFLSLKTPPKYIVTMDADYSHSPREIPKLIAPVKSGCHLVIGSRYYQSGNARDWSVIRLTVSKIANLLTRLRVNARISDYTSGMRCYSTELVRRIINQLHSRTYEIQIETIRQANLLGSKMTEVPITFVNRKKGKSKLTINEIRDFLFYILSFN